MDFKVFDKEYEHRLVMFNDHEIQFRNREATVPAHLAYHLARYKNEHEFVIEKKRVPFDPDSWKKDKRVIWSGNVASANGFGMVAENTIKELMKLGCKVFTPGGQSGNPSSGGELVDPLVLEAIGKDIKPNCLEIQHVQPPAFKNNIVQRQWMYTMFETTHIPRSWVKMLNQAERIIVPTEWLVDSWKEQGVTVPINVIGHGIDPEIYYYLERPERDTYTFLHYGQLSVRKGSDLVMRAFVEEFKGQDDVKLVLKNVHPFFPPHAFSTKNVTCIPATYTKDQMRKLMQDVDCMLFPTRGEGFGLPPFEAMATGLPTIVTGWSGPVDFSDPVDTLMLKYSMTRSENFDEIYSFWYEQGEDSGTWAEPDLEDLKSKMRWCYEHRAEAKEMGRKAAERIAREWKWSDKIKQLYDLIDTNL